MRFHKQARLKGFTLVELLVVIAIIALLLSVLLPSLQRVRESARILIDQTNMKQIGHYISLYQSDNDGTVPVVFNRYWADRVPSRCLAVSLALRHYADMKPLPRHLNPEVNWYATRERQRKEYFRDYLPEIFVCPFIREDEPGVNVERSTTVRIEGQTYSGVERVGYSDTYSPWRWDRHAKWAVFTTYPMGPPHGTNKYPTLSWNVQDQMNHTGMEATQLIDKRKTWDGNALKRVKATSLSDVTVLFCEKGQYDNYAGGNGAIWNYGSHSKGSKGGTNTLFADMHVGWVEGTRIGWP